MACKAKWKVPVKYVDFEPFITSQKYFVASEIAGKRKVYRK